MATKFHKFYMLAVKDLVFSQSAFEMLSVQAKTSAAPQPILPYFATTATFSCSMTRTVANAVRTLHSLLCASVGVGGSFRLDFGWIGLILESNVNIVRKASISLSRTDSSETLGPVEKRLATLESAWVGIDFFFKFMALDGMLNLKLDAGRELAWRSRR